MGVPRPKSLTTKWGRWDSSETAWIGNRVLSIQRADTSHSLPLLPLVF